jgi:hypothetical protein
MKHFSESLPDWLTQQQLQPLFLKLPTLCDDSGLYIVDRDQHGSEWPLGADITNLRII